MLSRGVALVNHVPSSLCEDGDRTMKWVWMTTPLARVRSQAGWVSAASYGDEDDNDGRLVT